MKLAIIAMIIQALAMAGTAEAPSVPSSSPEQQLLKLVNLERENAGLEKLQWDPQVAEAARAHAQLQAANNMLSHQLPGEPELDRRVGAAGAHFNAVAENVALADTPEEAHLALMNSPGHRHNILSPEYSAVGIGVAQAQKSLFITEDFVREVPVYSSKQFREGVIAAFNRARQAKGLQAVESHADSQLERVACSGKNDAGAARESSPGATRAVVFTASRPEDLPPVMELAASDRALHRMDIGVCSKSEAGNGFSHFWVVATFYPGK